MAFAVNLYFDENTESQIFRYWEKFDAAHLPNKKQRSFRPHITLCIFDHINCADCECRISAISSNFSLHVVTLDHLGIFNDEDNVLFLAPMPDARLLAMQEHVYKELLSFSTRPWDLYRPHTWVPHCTLANDLDHQQLLKAVGIALAIPLPIKARVSQIGIIEFDPIQPIFQVNISE